MGAPQLRQALAPPTLLDRVVGWMSPARGLRRHFQRQALARAYEAASPMDKWKPRRAGASPDADHAADGKVLRDKARSLVQNVPYVAAGLRSLVANTVGTGIQRISRDTLQADAINTLHAEWSEVCDADGRLTLAALEALAYQAAEVDGEVLIRRRWRRPQDGLPVPMQIQLLEIDWLDSSKNGREGGDTVINGIQYDVLGRRVGYWLFEEHPGAVQGVFGFPGTKLGRSRMVPARDIIHFFAPNRPGQGRGFTGLASIIASARDLRLYMDAEIARKNLETRLAVVASGDASLLAEADIEAASKAAGELGSLPSGGIVGIPAGLNLNTVQPNAAPGYVDTVKFDLHLIAAGWGVPYEDMTGDMRQSTWTSARMRQQTYRREREMVQWLHVIPGLSKPIWRWFIEAAQLEGKARLRREAFAVEFSTPRWEYTNPQQDVNADLALVAGGLMSPSELIRRRGYDPAKVLAELKDDIDAWKAAGLLDVLLAMQKARATVQDQAEANADAAASANAN